jgi:integrase
MPIVSCVSESGVTFSQQSELWLAALKTRKRKPVSPATLHAFGSYLRRLNEMIGEKKLCEINNGALRQLVQILDSELSPKTVGELVAVVKSVVASLVDEETGAVILKREWSAKHIDCPTVAKQKQPCLTAADINRCIEEATSNQEALLYALLGGTGMRISEALCIHVCGSADQTSWDQVSGAITIRSSLYNGKEIQRVKTEAGRRTVDLDPSLNGLIARFVELNQIQPGDYLFQTRRGRAMHVNTARNRLAARGIPGFHAFRRFFISRRRRLGFPECLLTSIVGHSGAGITDLYDKSAQDETYRKEWAAKVGLGFALPEFRNATHPAPQSTSTPKPDTSVMRGESVQTPHATEIRQPYVAEDNDLAEFFYSTPEPAVQEA